MFAGHLGKRTSVRSRRVQGDFLNEIGREKQKNKQKKRAFIVLPTQDSCSPILFSTISLSFSLINRFVNLNSYCSMPFFWIDALRSLRFLKEDTQPNIKEKTHTEINSRRKEFHKKESWFDFHLPFLICPLYVCVSERIRKMTYWHLFCIHFQKEQIGICCLSGTKNYKIKSQLKILWTQFITSTKCIFVREIWNIFV